jgi:hypothetical protein
MAGEALVAAVRLVGDDDDIAPLREHQVAVAVLFKKELVVDGDDEAARGGQLL